MINYEPDKPTDRALHALAPSLGFGMIGPQCYRDDHYCGADPADEPDD